jgi:hypothetical protein
MVRKWFRMKRSLPGVPRLSRHEKSSGFLYEKFVSKAEARPEMVIPGTRRAAGVAAVVR